ncbi:protoporphyrinogen oxidase-like isoform X2 [Liolophura sinensis]|uniref:protoporphyrinogen oxidase-like isoform X2 n=1 Tax=Liolophura sinensis TaxID=3198878 RepID=UPI0031591A71
MSCSSQCSLGLGGVLRTLSPFSKPWVFSLASEPFRARSSEEDESVDSFIRRRLGPEIAEYAIDPMCRGIYAGNSRELSVRSCFPPLYKCESEDGSIVRGMLWPSKGRQRPERRSKLSKRARDERWAAWSLRDGTSQLTDTLVTQLSEDPRVEVRVGSPCEAVTPTDGKLQVVTQGETIQADHVFSSLYAAALSSLLPDQLVELKAFLSSIPAVTVAVVNLEYSGHVLPAQGFGHLLPSSEDGKMLGVVYDSCAFPEHDRQDKPSTRLTVMMGGAWIRELVSEVGSDLNENALTSLAVKGVQDQLGIVDSPSRSITKVQRNCIPQYLVGHWQKLAGIHSLTEKTNLPLSYIGSSYQGASVNDCIYNAKLEVERVLSS